jgi:hypothetical protein
MATGSAHRSVTVERTANGRFTVTNTRGGRIDFGTGDGTDFTPTELLLAAIGGCTAIDVDILTSRRAEPEDFEVLVDADKVRDAAGNHLADVTVTFGKSCLTRCRSHTTGSARLAVPSRSARPSRSGSSDALPAKRASRGPERPRRGPSRIRS